MTTQNRENDPGLGGICTACGHDLVVRVIRAVTGKAGSKRDLGKLYCSNEGCPYHSLPHPSGKDVNCPPELRKQE